MKKLLFLLLVPALASADRLGSLKSDADVLLSTQAVSGASTGGTITAAPQFSLPYYSLPGSTTTVAAFPGVSVSTNTGVTVSTLTVSTATFTGEIRAAGGIRMPDGQVANLALWRGAGLTTNLCGGAGACGGNPSSGNLTSLGTLAGFSLTAGGNNTFIGSQAGQNATSATQDVYIGAGVDGNYSDVVAIGYHATPTGDANTIIGSGAQTGSGVTESVALGHNANATTSNTIQLGASGTTVSAYQANIASNTVLTGGATFYANAQPVFNNITINGTCTGTGCGGGTVTITGSPVAGNLTKFSGATSITSATVQDLVNQWSGCTVGTQYLGYDGACHTASSGAGGGASFIPNFASTSTASIFSTTSLTYVAHSSLTLTMAAVNATSRIMITFSGTVFTGSNAAYGRVTVYKDGVDIDPTGQGFLATTNSQPAGQAFTWFYTPGDTNSHTYQIYAKSGGGSVSICLGQGNGGQFFSLLEVPSSFGFPVLATSVGVVRSSPTTDIIFNPDQFTGSLTASSMTVTINTSSITAQGPIVSSITLSAMYGAPALVGTNFTSLPGAQVGSGVPATNIAAGSLGASVVASSFPVSGVTAGSYTSANITVNAQGLVTAAANGTGGGGGGYAVEPATVPFQLNRGVSFSTFTSTTGDFIYNGSTITKDGGIITSTMTRCATIENLIATDSGTILGSWPQNVQVTGAWCTCSGVCTTTAQFGLEDGAGNAMTVTAPTCAKVVGAVYTAGTIAGVYGANSLLVRDPLRFTIANAPDPTTDEYSLCVSYQVTGTGTGL